MPQRARKTEEPRQRFRRKLGRKSGPVPVSSHPEVDDEIELHGGGIDESRVRIDSPRPAVKPIVSVDGRDVEDDRFQSDKAA